MSVMAKIYTAVKTVLDNDAAIIALLPADNIRPTDDASEPEPGNMIYYNWQGGAWDLKARRGRGTLAVSTGSVDDKVNADEILDLVRAALTARALTYPGSPIRVHKFREVDSLNDSGTADSGRSLAATTFDVRLVEA